MVRPLEPIPLEHDGHKIVALRDPTGFSQNVAVLPLHSFVLVQMMDGTRTREGILAEVDARFGLRLDPAQLEELIEGLDRALLLDSPRARQVLGAQRERPAAHVGTAYPAEPEELRLFLDGILARLPRRRPLRLKALMAPHIDLARGADSYAFAYDRIGATREAEAFVVLGISHAPARNPYVLTRKSFLTPLGTVPTAVELVDELVAGCDFDPFLDEFNHVGEHSVEFQAVWLRHVLGEVPIVPVLCGSFQEPLVGGGRPEDIPGVASFLNALRGLMERRRVCLVAGVDLSHVGVRFGGSPLSDGDLEALRRADLASLERVTAGDAAGFFASLQADGGRRNWCGTSAIYTMLAVLGQPGSLDHYQQCNEPGNLSTVAVAAAYWEG